MTDNSELFIPGEQGIATVETTRVSLAPWLPGSLANILQGSKEQSQAHLCRQIATTLLTDNQ